MESSSEDSFAWTDTSSDKSESGVMVNEQESDFDKSFKRKLQKELFKNGDRSEPENDEPRVKKKKKIKREPKSPSPVKREANGHDEAAAAVLSLKLEREHAPAAARRLAPGDHPPPSKRKRDRGRRDSARDSVEAEEPPRKKKKKRKKETSDTEEPIIDKFEAEETVVQECRPESRSVRRRASTASLPDARDADLPDAQDADLPDARDADLLDARDAGLLDARDADLPDARDADLHSGDERPAPAPGALGVRERFTFEEEPDEPAGSDGSARGGRLARYLRARPGLRAAGGAAPRACAVGAHDDAWLLLAPRGLAAGALAGALLAPGARRRLEAGGRRYEALGEPAPARAALLAGAARRLRGVALRGALRLRERAPRARAVPAPAAPDAPRAVPLPATRARHPLLGADYERALRPAPAAERRRRASVAAPEPEPAPEEPAVRRKKKKKRSRRSPPPAAAWDSERAIEASLFGC